MLDKNYKLYLRNHLRCFGTRQTLERLNKRFNKCISGYCCCNICHIGDRDLATKIVSRLMKKEKGLNVFL